MSEYTAYDLVGGITNVSGSGGTFAVTGELGAYIPWTEVPGGSKVYYNRFDGAHNFEAGRATVSHPGGVPTLTRIAVDRSSNGGGAVTWAPGATQNLICTYHSGAAVHRHNNLSDLADAVAALAFLGGASRFATGLSGGSNSTVCRPNGAGAVATANNTDSFASLWPLYWRGPDGLLYRPGEVPGTFTAGQKYWLGVGALLTAPPTVSTTVFGVFIGIGLTSGLMDFRPSPPWRLA